MRTPIFLLAAALICLPDFCFSQEKKWLAGRLFLENDSLRTGLIADGSDALFKTELQFRPAKSSTMDPEIWSVESSNLTGFEFADGRKYRRFEYKKDSASRVEYVFGRLILVAKISLWRVQPNTLDNPQLYFAEKEGRFYPLEFYVDELRIKQQPKKKYVGMLRFLTFDCASKIGKDDFEKLSFREDALIDFLKKYQRCAEPKRRTIDFSTKKYSDQRRGVTVFVAPVQRIARLDTTAVAPALVQTAGVGLISESRFPTISKRASAILGVSLEYRAQRNVGNLEQNYRLLFSGMGNFRLLDGPISPYFGAGGDFAFRHFDFTLRLEAGLYVGRTRFAASLNTLGKFGGLFRFHAAYLFEKTGKARRD